MLVHGDTPTSFAEALAVFYMKIPVGRAESELLFYNIYAPFPEEFDRQTARLIMFISHRTKYREFRVVKNKLSAIFLLQSVPSFFRESD